MPDAQKGDYRAHGALDNFIAEMRAKLEREGRSEDYCNAFWEGLKDAASDFAHLGKV
jgi:hypothetical protein